MEHFIQEKAVAHRCNGLIILCVELVLESFGNVTGANATCANFDSLDAAILNSSDLLKVGIPYGAGFIIGMAHVVAEAGPFSTNITFS